MGPKKLRSVWKRLLSAYAPSEWHVGFECGAQLSLTLCDRLCLMGGPT